MKITFLGTSHGTATRNRFNSSLLVETENGKYLLDAGQPVDALLIRKDVDLNDIKAVFVTHMHGDHVCGLPHLLKMFMKNSRGKHLVFLPEEGADAGIKAFMETIHVPLSQAVAEFRTTKAGTVYSDEDVTVTAFETRHVCLGEKNAAFGYIFRTKTKSVMITGDISQGFFPYLETARNEYFDACVFEGTHYDPMTVINELSTCKFGKLFINHVREEWHDDEGVTFAEKNFFSRLPYYAKVVGDGEEYTV